MFVKNWQLGLNLFCFLLCFVKHCGAIKAGVYIMSENLFKTERNKNGGKLQTQKQAQHGTLQMFEFKLGQRLPTCKYKWATNTLTSQLTYSLTFLVLTALYEE